MVVVVVDRARNFCSRSVKKMAEETAAAAGRKQLLLMYTYLLVYILLSSGQIFFNKVPLWFPVFLFSSLGCFLGCCAVTSSNFGNERSRPASVC